MPGPNHRGLILFFFTGLPGAGKSTLAQTLAVRLADLGRTVTLLDGDEVRRLLSSGLGYSREHRDLNVRRIGYVAAEIARHGGIAICAQIAPYAAARAGLLPGFTGVSDPYEPPQDADVSIDAQDGTPLAAAETIIARLRRDRLLE